MDTSKFTAEPFFVTSSPEEVQLTCANTFFKELLFFFHWASSSDRLNRRPGKTNDCCEIIQSPHDPTEGFTQTLNTTWTFQKPTVNGAAWLIPVSRAWKERERKGQGASERIYLWIEDLVWIPFGSVPLHGKGPGCVVNVTGGDGRAWPAEDYVNLMCSLRSGSGEGEQVQPQLDRLSLPKVFSCGCAASHCTHRAFHSQLPCPQPLACHRRFCACQ